MEIEKFAILREVVSGPQLRVANMSVFAYTALDARRAGVKGLVSADSAGQARELLRERGLLVQTVEPHRSASDRLRLLRGFRTSDAQLAATAREIATLLAVGVPLVDALDTIIRQQKGAMKDALLMIRDRVSGGMSLAEAMAVQPRVFDELTRRMVEVGENAGNLEVVLEQVADFKQRAGALKDQVLAAILYPAIVLCASLLVTVFLMTVVVPMLLTNLTEAGRELPWPTRVLRGISEFLVSHGVFLVLGISIVCVVLGGALKTTKGKRICHRLVLRLPLLGSMATKQAISRTAMVLATLMRSGIVYAQAADIAARSCKNSVFRDAILSSNEEIRAGQDIGDALEKTGVFPPLVVHLVSVGQASGKLEDMLERLSRNYDNHVNALATRLAAVLEPVLILFLAVVVGFILLATLLPILEAGNVLA